MRGSSIVRSLFVLSLSIAGCDGVSVSESTRNVVTRNGDSLNGDSLNGMTLNGSQLSATTLSGSLLIGNALVGTTFDGVTVSGKKVHLRIDSYSQGTGALSDVYYYGISWKDSSTWRSICANGEQAIAVSGRWNYSQGVPGGGSKT